MNSAAFKFSTATPVASGRLPGLAPGTLGELVEILIGRELSDAEFLGGRSYLLEDVSPKINNLYFCYTSHPAEFSTSGLGLRQTLA